MRSRLLAVVAFIASSFAISAPALPVKALDSFSEPEMIAHAVVAPTSPQTSGPAGFAAPYNQVPWGLDRIDQRGNTLDHSFSFSGNGAGVKVYIVDSGVNAAHTDLGARVVNGWSYRADTTPDGGGYRNSLLSYHRATTPQPSSFNSTTGLPSPGATFSPASIPECPSNPTTQQYSPSVFDDPVSDIVNGQTVYKESLFTLNADTSDKGKVDNDGHGTHVAGTIGGDITGVAKGVTIVPVRVLDSCGAGTTSMVHNGLRWILADHQNGERAVVNMSIGFDASATAIDTDISDLMAEGIVVVAAAGNDGGSACNTTPAGTTGTISVGAIQSSGAEAYYSNFGQCVDLFAPGSDVVSTWPKNGSQPNPYYLESGTSMAAPHVSGVVATELANRTIDSLHPEKTQSDIWNWLKLNSSCDVVTYNNPALAATAQTANRVLNNGSAAGPACKPTTVTATVANAATTLTWTEPASPNGSALTGYTATLSPGGQSCSTNASTLTCTISGLTNNTTYTASVRGVNAVGASVQAATVSVTPIGVPMPVTNLVAGVGNNSLIMSWTQQPGDGPGITYVATATPGNATCTVVNANTCTIEGLTNGVTYSVSVVGTNSLGSAAAVTATGKPDGPPPVPTNVSTVMSSRSITVSWPAVTGTLGVTYKVTVTPGGASCTTSETTCALVGLTNGVAYTFQVVSIAPSGKVSAASVFTARPGFNVLTTTVKKKSKTTLSKIVTTPSKGRKTWRETGTCSIVAGKLVAPSKATKCKVILKVAKSSTYPAMSTTVVVTVK